MLICFCFPFWHFCLCLRRLGGGQSLAGLTLVGWLVTERHSPAQELPFPPSLRDRADVSAASEVCGPSLAGVQLGGCWILFKPVSDVRKSFSFPSNNYCVVLRGMKIGLIFHVSFIGNPQGRLVLFFVSSLFAENLCQKKPITGGSNKWEGFHSEVRQMWLLGGINFHRRVQKQLVVH